LEHYFSLAVIQRIYKAAGRPGMREPGEDS